MFACLRAPAQDSNVVLRACGEAGFQPRIAYQSDDYFAIQGLWPAAWAWRWSRAWRSRASARTSRSAR